MSGRICDHTDGPCWQVLVYLPYRASLDMGILGLLLVL